MSLYTKVKAVERVFSLLDKDISRFRSETSITCKSGCGECCKKPEIEATILEFLPFAYSLYKEGKAFEWLDKVLLHPKDDLLCMLFTTVSSTGKAGMCSVYPYRGLICRLFGFSASLDKYGKPRFSTCRVIKENFSEQYQQVVSDIESNNQFVPVMRNYYFALFSIDPRLSEKRFPINVAIRKALEEVCFYYAYRGKRSG